jgi:hypothetical protein
MRATCIVTGLVRRLLQRVRIYFGRVQNTDVSSSYRHGTELDIDNTTYYGGVRNAFIAFGRVVRFSVLLFSVLRSQSAKPKTMNREVPCCRRL